MTNAILFDATGRALHAPDTFKRAASSGTTQQALWTPATGKRFRLLKYMIEVAANAAATGGATIACQFYDGATQLPLSRNFYAPTTAVTTNPGCAFTTGIVDLGGIGIPSSAENNVLNVNLSVALATGTCVFHAWGIEEA